MQSSRYLAMSRPIGALAAAMTLFGALTACAGSSSPSSPATPSPRYTGIAGQLAAQGAKMATDTPGKVAGTWNGLPFLCIRTGASEIGNYGVQASERDGAYQCGLTGYPTPEQNQAFGRVLGY
jgi:hypothetical protein